MVAVVAVVAEETVSKIGESNVSSGKRSPNVVARHGSRTKSCWRRSFPYQLTASLDDINNGTSSIVWNTQIALHFSWLATCMSRNTLRRLSSNQCGSDNSLGSSRRSGEEKIGDDVVVDLVVEVDEEQVGVVPASIVIKPDHPNECTSTEELDTA